MLPLKANSLNENDNVVFRHILVADSNAFIGRNETTICIQSKLNGKLLSVRGQELAALTENISDHEKFIVFHGSNDIIGLKSKLNGKFIGAHANKNKLLQVNRDKFLEAEMFKVIPVLEKYTFPPVV